MMYTQPLRIGALHYRVDGRDEPGHDGFGIWNACGRSEPSISCKDNFRAFSPVKGRSLDTQGNRLKIRVTNGRRAESVVIL